MKSQFVSDAAIFFAFNKTSYCGDKRFMLNDKMRTLRKKGYIMVPKVSIKQEAPALLYFEGSALFLLLRIG